LLIAYDAIIFLNNRGSGKKTWWVHRSVESCANCANAWKVWINSGQISRSWSSCWPSFDIPWLSL